MFIIIILLELAIIVHNEVRVSNLCNWCNIATDGWRIVGSPVRSARQVGVFIGPRTIQTRNIFVHIKTNLRCCNEPNTHFTIILRTKRKEGRQCTLVVGDGKNSLLTKYIFVILFGTSLWWDGQGTAILREKNIYYSGNDLSSYVERWETWEAECWDTGKRKDLPNTAEGHTFYKI